MIKAVSISVYIFFGIVSYSCIRTSTNKIMILGLYFLFFLLELWIIVLVDFNNIFKIASFYLIFNVSFIYLYIIFRNTINTGVFNLMAFLSLVVVAVIYYYMNDICNKVHMILNPFSLIIGCYFYVVWIGLFLYNKTRFDRLMFLKFPFEIYFEFGRILSKNLI
jgi:hypothetical protein